ncbi:MAG: hypothetical protein ACI9F1_001887 [Colwellia sp.]|jgi:hypothetical protein
MNKFMNLLSTKKSDQSARLMNSLLLKLKVTLA